MASTLVVALIFLILAQVGMIVVLAREWRKENRRWFESRLDCMRLRDESIRQDRIITVQGHEIATLRRTIELAKSASWPPGTKTGRWTGGQGVYTARARDRSAQERAAISRGDVPMSERTVDDTAWPLPLIILPVESPPPLSTGGAAETTGGGFTTSGDGGTTGGDFSTGGSV